MRIAPDHERWQDAAGAYLLGALRDVEVREYEAHLAVCEACRQEVDHLRVAADALPASAEQLEPPPELRDRIMAIARTEAELLQAAGAGADRGAAPPRRRGLGGRWSIRPAFALAATLLVLAGGGVVGWALSSSGGPDVRTVVASVEAPGAGAKLIVRDERARLVTTGMPAPGIGRVYQVWLKRPGRQPEPTDALFDVRRGGSASVDVPGTLDGVEAVLVTSEPQGGSLKPSRAPVITAVPA